MAAATNDVRPLPRFLSVPLSSAHLKPSKTLYNTTLPLRFAGEQRCQRRRLDRIRLLPGVHAVRAAVPARHAQARVSRAGE